MKKSRNVFVRAWERLVEALGWPERVLARYRARRAKRLARKPLLVDLPKPRAKTLGERVRKLFGMPDRGYVPPPMPQAQVKRSLGNRIRRLFGSPDFVVSYERRRRTPAMWLGAIPAVLALVLLGVVSFGFDVSQPSMTSKYRKTADKAQEDGNDALAELALRRVAKGSITEEEKFRLVGLELKRKQTDRAAALVDEMVSADRQGYPRAHWQKVEFMLQQGVQSEDQWRELEAHLKYCLDDESLRYRAHFLLGDVVYRRYGKWSLAEQHLKKAMIRIPDANLALVPIYVALGKNQQVPTLYRDYIDREIGRLDLEPANEDLRDKLVASYLALNDHQKALDLLERAPALAGSPRLAVARAEVLARYAAHELAEKREANAFRLVEAGLSAYPNYGRLYAVLVKLAAGDSANAGEANARLEKLLAAGGPLTDSMHYLVAVNAAAANDFEKARRHFDIVFKNNPNAPAIANNLAVTLAGIEPPQLDRALDLVNRALDAMPKPPATPEARDAVVQMRETRGQIYVKQKKWDEALADLTFVVREMPGHAGVHRGLAETYDALGEKTLADQHRRNAKTLTEAARQPAARNPTPKK